MPDSKGETSGKALTFEANGGYATVYPEQVARALLANPEARMAVLGAMPEFVDAQTAAATRLVSAAHLEEAAELLRDSCAGKGVEWRLRLEQWAFRDQTLSAPTAESSEGCDKCGSGPHDPCDRGVDHSEPAPVAEAPERVSHEQAWGICCHLGSVGEPRFDIMNRYIAQQEQLEREVTSLRDDHREYMLKAGDEYSKVLAERDSLRAKLSESERKLGEIDTAIYETRGQSRLEFLARAGKLRIYRKEQEPAAKEPTGGEPAKLDPRCNCPWPQYPGKVTHQDGCPALSPVAPPAAEAEPRFLSSTASSVTHADIEADMAKTDCSVSGCGDLARTYGLCFAHARAAGRDAALAGLPADPAPPRPGAPSCSKSGACIHPDGHWYPCSSEPDRPVMMGELVRALEKLVNRGGIILPDSPGSWFGRLAEELEREGSEKP